MIAPSYGEGLIYIKNIDIWIGKVRLTVFDITEESEMYIFMTHYEARDLAIDLTETAIMILKEKENG